MTDTRAPAPRPRTAAELDAATPPDRDRWADAIRVGSLLVVIVGHWLMVVLTPAGEITNALTLVPSLQPLTWFLQVMPLFFLVGGVAHAHTLESLDRRPGTRHGRYAAFFRSRASRLLRPTLAFLAVWVVVGVVADLTGLTSRPGDAGELARDALVMVPQLLWFIGMYLGVCAFAPLMRRLHQRHGLLVVAVLVGSACLVDVLRFTGAELVGNLNFAFVWLALHQLGFVWRDGLLTTRVGWAMLVGGFAAMGAAITWGPYPTSMVGLPGEAVSNMAPPTVALLAQGVGIAGLAVVLRPVMARVLARPRPWKVVVVASPYAMTAFLWHLTALMLVLLAVRALGITQPPVASGLWWLTRPLLFTVLGVVTAGFVAVFVRFDRGGRPIPARIDERRAWVDPLAAVSAFVLFFGILMVSIVGVDILGNRPVFFLVGDVTPIIGFAVLAVGLCLLRLTGPHQPADHLASGAAPTTPDAS
ncbi:acyltransferase [Intrasporangium oryzae NRRL B-24470]|uniref:Acyltransferase n=1 Tax=Intrasporangium oryzae NRRL B-24470 TaxID=1386089 RepID=W9G811_9MICO|nr:acyltransferase [Intrasporangium oryzae]EWT01412.1 acyltransferase [Intrasporangium oryzae NRRL B-24470]